MQTKLISLVALLYAMVATVNGRILPCDGSKKEAQRALQEAVKQGNSMMAGATKRGGKLDYKKTLRGVLARDPAALERLLRCNQYTDGAATEEYLGDLQAALFYVGDEMFAEAAGRLPPSLRVEVLQFLTDGCIEVWAKSFPRTQRLALRAR